MSHSRAHYYYYCISMFQPHCVPLPGPLSVCSSQTVSHSQVHYQYVPAPLCPTPRPIISMFQPHCVPLPGPLSVCPSPVDHCVPLQVSGGTHVLFCIKLEGLSEKHCVPSPQYGLWGGLLSAHGLVGHSASN